MPFLITCRDALDSALLRTRHLADHRRYVDEHARQIVLSGPLTDDDGARRIGQVFVLDVPDHAAASDFVNEDPFTLAGIFAHIRIDRLELRFEQGRRLVPALGGNSEATSCT